MHRIEHSVMISFLQVNPANERMLGGGGADGGIYILVMNF